MSVKLKISVTKEILERSAMCGTVVRDTSKENGVGANCAIALAIRDLFPDAWVSVDSIDFQYFEEDSSGYTMLDERYSSRLPLIASEFIRNFDNCSPKERVQMQPIDFEIEIPEAVLEKLDISEITEQLKGHSTLQLQEV